MGDAGAIVVGLIGILVAIVLAAFAIMWQSHRQGSRTDTRMDRLEDKMDALGHRISESEREQARLEGVNSVLQQMAHSHRPAADD